MALFRKLFVLMLVDAYYVKSFKVLCGKPTTRGNTSCDGTMDAPKEFMFYKKTAVGIPITLKETYDWLIVWLIHA